VVGRKSESPSHTEKKINTTRTEAKETTVMALSHRLYYIDGMANFSNVQDGSELINFASQVLNKSLKLSKEKRNTGRLRDQGIKGLSSSVQARTTGMGQ
jgi:hypothetical protein